MRPIQVLLVSQLGRRELTWPRRSHCVAALAVGERCADLVAGEVDRSGPLGDRLADLGISFLDQGEVARAEIQQGPVDADVEIRPAGEIAHERRSEIAAAAESAAAESQPERGQAAAGRFPV